MQRPPQGQADHDRAVRRARAQEQATPARGVARRSRAPLFHDARAPTEKDFLWWCQLPAADARAAIALCAGELVAETIDGTKFWRGAAATKPAKGPRAYLLPPYDEYTVVLRRSLARRRRAGSRADLQRALTARTKPRARRPDRRQLEANLGEDRGGDRAHAVGKAPSRATPPHSTRRPRATPSFSAARRGSPTQSARSRASRRRARDTGRRGSAGAGAGARSAAAAPRRDRAARSSTSR